MSKYFKQSLILLIFVYSLTLYWLALQYVPEKKELSLWMVLLYVRGNMIKSVEFTIFSTILSKFHLILSSCPVVTKKQGVFSPMHDRKCFHPGSVIYHAFDIFHMNHCHFTMLTIELLIYHGHKSASGFYSSGGMRYCSINGPSPPPPPPDE